MRTAFLLIAALVAFAASTNTADAQYPTRWVYRPSGGVSSGGVSSGGISSGGVSRSGISSSGVSSGGVSLNSRSFDGTFAPPYRSVYGYYAVPYSGYYYAPPVSGFSSGSGSSPGSRYVR